MKGMHGNQLLVVEANTQSDFSDPLILFRDHLESADTPYEGAVSYSQVAIDGLNRARHSGEFDSAMACVLNPEIATQIHRIDDDYRPEKMPRIIGQDLGNRIAREVLNFADNVPSDPRGGLESWAKRRKEFVNGSKIREFDMKIFHSSMKVIFRNELLVIKQSGADILSPRARVATDAVSVLNMGKFIKRS